MTTFTQRNKILSLVRIPFALYQRPFISFGFLYITKFANRCSAEISNQPLMKTPVADIISLPLAVFRTTVFAKHAFAHIGSMFFRSFVNTCRHIKNYMSKFYLCQA